jgi:hypothetical protein
MDKKLYGIAIVIATFVVVSYIIAGILYVITNFK